MPSPIISREKLLELCGNYATIQGAEPASDVRVLDVGEKFLVVVRKIGDMPSLIALDGIQRIDWKTEQRHELVRGA